MSLEPKKRLGKITHAVVLAAFLATGLTACGLAWELNQMHEGIFNWPRGSIAPEGLEQITGETTRDEVNQILGSRYGPDPDEYEWPNGYVPDLDVFLYKEGGGAKFIEVWFARGTVSYINYGYDFVHGIE